MRVALLAGANSIHTERWANGLCGAGVELHLISQHTERGNLDESVCLHRLPIQRGFGYFANVFALRRLLGEIKPDLLNAHYASGYGTLARLSGFHPYCLNIWGSDVYLFPKKSRLHASLIRGNLAAPDWVASTSHCMLKEAMNYNDLTRRSSVVPFGVDVGRFELTEARDSADLVIGTIKSLKPVYGIDLLIRAFAKVLAHHETWGLGKSGRGLRLRIVGDGSERENLSTLARALKVESRIDFVGWVRNEDVPAQLQQMDIFASLSRSESFGVSVLEAGAAGLPVVASDADGFRELVLADKTGYIVPSEDVDAAAEALIRLLANFDLRKNLGSAGRKHVEASYVWSDNVAQLIEVFHATIRSAAPPPTY